MAFAHYLAQNNFLEPSKLESLSKHPRLTTRTGESSSTDIFKMALVLGSEETREILRRIKEVTLAFGNCSPFSFSEQIEVFLDGMKQGEKTRRKYMSQSPQLHMRGRLVNFILSIAEREKYCCSTTVHAVYLYDRFADVHTISEKQIYLVALSCLIIAAKMEEEDSNTPKIRHMCRYLPPKTEFAYSLFVLIEKFILRFFDFKILVPTEVNFVDLFLLFALDGVEFMLLNNNNNNTPDEVIEDFKKKKYSVVLSDIHTSCLQVVASMVQSEPSSLYAPSLVAAAILMFARRENHFNFWTSRLSNVTGYSLKDITACLQYYLEPIAVPDINIRAKLRAPELLDVPVSHYIELK